MRISDETRWRACVFTTRWLTCPWLTFGAAATFAILAWVAADYPLWLAASISLMFWAMGLYIRRDFRSQGLDVTRWPPPPLPPKGARR